jgi:glycosyltransferase involved in cell wall biosynthesis
MIIGGKTFTSNQIHSLNSNPLVTVLMPVYNGGKYLKFSIESVLAQTYKDFEFLLINDCSTDDSMKTIRSFKDSRIVVHTNAANVGQTKSLNLGLKLAQGKYIARMDADDMAYPQWIEHILKIYEKYPNYAAIGSAAIVINSHGEVKDVRKAPISWYDILFRIFFAPPMNHVSTLLNRDLILGYGGYDEEFEIAQDYELWSSLIRKGYRIANSPAILVSYRVHESSLSTTNLKKRGLQEKAETLFRNVLSMTDATLTREDALKITKFFYDTARIDEDEFYYSRNMFENIYCHLKPLFHLPGSILRSRMKQQMLIPYCKFAFEEVKREKFTNARCLCLGYNRRYGFHPFPILIAVASLFGKGAEYMLAKWFEKYRELKAVFYLNLSKTSR